jgi:hypothetical protein
MIAENAKSRFGDHAHPLFTRSMKSEENPGWGLLSKGTVSLVFPSPVIVKRMIAWKTAKTSSLVGSPSAG